MIKIKDALEVVSRCDLPSLAESWLQEAELGGYCANRGAENISQQPLRESKFCTQPLKLSTRKLHGFQRSI